MVVLFLQRRYTDYYSRQLTGGVKSFSPSIQVADSEGRERERCVPAPKISDSDVNSSSPPYKCCSSATTPATVQLSLEVLLPKHKQPPTGFCLRRRRLRSEHRRWYSPLSILPYKLQSSIQEEVASRYLGASGSRKWLLAMDGGETPAAATHKAATPFVPDGELMELLWQDGAVVAHSQAQPQAHQDHHYHNRALLHVGAGNGNTGASGVTEELPALPWHPGGGVMGGDVYSQLWQSIAQQADGRMGADANTGESAGTAVARPPAKSGNSGAGSSSSRTAGEVAGCGSSFCGSNLIAAAMHLDDDIDDVGPALPMSLEDPAAGTGAGAGASTSSGWNSNGVSKRSRDEFDEDADFDAVDETPPSSRDRRPASSKRRTRAAEVHNMSERRRRDRINEKMRALQELVPHCNKTDKASILDEAIEYLKSLQMQVQIMWMSTGMAPMMIPGAHQLMPQMPTPAVQFLSQMQRMPPPFMNNPLPNQMAQILPPSTNAPGVSDQAQSNRMALPRNPFFHPNESDALMTPPQVPSLFGYGPQMVQVNEIQELLTGTAAPALGTDLPSSSDGTGT